MVNTNPLRIAADTVDANITAGKVTETLLDALMKRTSLVLTPTETLSSYNFATGSPPYSVIYGQTGYVYFYNPDDTTTADDGSTCLVSADGRRYILADMSAMAISSVLSKTNTPPGSPTDGDAYVVDTAPTGAWVGHAKNIALYTPRGWVFAAAKVGTALLDQATGGNLQYNAAGSWAAMPTTIAASGVTPAQLLFPMGLSVEAQQNAPPGSPVANDGLHYLVGLAPTGAWSGQSNKIAYYNSSSAWAYLAAYDGATIFNKASDASLTWFDATGDWRPQWPIASVCEGRLTLATGTAIATTDQTAKATLYFTPFRGNTIALHTGGGWSLRTFVETSLSLSGYTTGKPFDIFAYDNSGTLALESLVWTDDTTRATALALQDGVLVKNGDATRRYLGTIYTTATGQTEDSLLKRMVFNYYNRVLRPMLKQESTSSWTYTSATVRQARATATNQVEFMLGVSEDEITADLVVMASSSGGQVNVGIGLDSTTTTASGATTIGSALTGNAAAIGRYAGQPAAGRHRLTWLEWTGSGAVTGTFNGLTQSCLNARIIA